MGSYYSNAKLHKSRLLTAETGKHGIFFSLQIKHKSLATIELVGLEGKLASQGSKHEKL